MTVEYRIQPPEPATAARRVVLDPSQQAVLDHVATVGGPLQVLAGPGTGKTTTLVELVAQRVESGAVAADEVLVLTFSRAAAQEVRARIARRLGRTVATTPAMTFHSFCYALVRAEQGTTDFRSPVSLLSAPEQDAVLADLLAGTDPQEWPEALRPALRTRGLTAELQRLLGAARAQGLDSVDLLAVGQQTGRADWQAAARFFDDVTSVAAFTNTIDHTDLVFQAVTLLDDPECRRRWRDRLRLVVVDEFQDTDPLQVALLQALAGDGRYLVVVGDPYRRAHPRPHQPLRRRHRGGGPLGRREPRSGPGSRRGAPRRATLAGHRSRAVGQRRGAHVLLRHRRGRARGAPAARSPPGGRPTRPLGPHGGARPLLGPPRPAPPGAVRRGRARPGRG